MNQSISLSSVWRAGGAVVALALGLTACGQHGMPKPEGMLLDGVATVPMESVEGRLVISAMLNGRGPYKFIVDSGAAVSLLAAPLAVELGLPVTGRMDVGSPGSSTSKPATLNRVDSLEIGELRVKGVTFLGMDLSALQQKVPGLEGVISAHLFEGLLVCFDFPALAMEFRRGELPVADGQSVFSWARGERLPGVLMHIGVNDVRVDIDTGSPGPISLARENTRDLQWLEAPEERKPIKLIDTEYKAFRGRLKGTVTFGAFSLENPELVYHEGPFNNVGLEVLKDFVLTIDPANRRFELRR